MTFISECFWLSGVLFVVASGLLLLLFYKRYSGRGASCHAPEPHEDPIEAGMIYKRLFESAPFGIFRATLDGTILEINQAFADMFGYETPDRMMVVVNETGIGKRFQEDRNARDMLIGKVLDNPGWVTCDDVVRNRSGEALRVRLKMQRAYGTGDSPVVEGFIQDITGVRKQEEAHRKSEAHYQALFESAGDAIFLLKDGVFTDCNLKTLEMFSCEKGQIIGATPAGFSPETQPDGTASLEKSGDYIAQALTGEQVVFEWQHTRKTGGVFDAEVTLSRIDSPDGDYLLAIVRDITERKHYETQLELARKVFDNAVEGVVVTDEKGTIEFVNPSFEEITGYTATEAIGNNPRMLKSNHHGPEFYQKMWEDLIDKGYWYGEIWNRRKNGEVFPEWLSISAIKDAQGNTVRFMSIFHDLTETKRKERLLHFQSNHDALTGLPNRALFIERLKDAISQAERNKWGLTLLFLGLDNFKKINDTMGHLNGDILLQMVAMRLQSCSRNEDTVGRLGGDEFVYLMQRNNTPQNTLQVIHRIQEAMAEPFYIAETEFSVNISIGITTFPVDGSDYETLVANADIAMYQAKKQGRNTYRYFTPVMNEQMTRLVNLENKLHKALARKEITVYYQPKVSVKTGRIIGMEALARWEIKGEGMVSPAEFIPMAEDTGLIVPIGAWILEEACRQTQRWRMDLGIDLKVAVNLSPRQFKEQDLMECVSTALSQSGLPPDALELEVTESTLIQETERVQTMLEQAKQKGISVALDDFGTGYSSLSYLRRFSIDVLKIDKAFIDDIPHDQEANILVTTMLSMAQGLNIRVVAEGVETCEQLTFLSDNGCDYIQGYLYSRPVPQDAFEALLDSPDLALQPSK